MRLDLFITILSLYGSTAASAIAVSGSSEAPNGLAQRDENGNELYKRKGGGGGGGRGGGGRSGSTGGSRGGGSSSKPKPGSSGSSSSSGSRGGSSSSSGSIGGSGAPRAFGGGKFYGGGAAKPYKSGSKSPSGIVPLLFVSAAALAIWPGVWLYGAYHYPYTHPYAFHNDTTDADEELPVLCACAPYNPCGCDENEDDEYLKSLVGNGDYSQLNQSLVTVAEVNGTETLLINGTLPNGTTAPEDSAALGMRSSLELLGYWPMVAAACAAVFMGT